MEFVKESKTNIKQISRVNLLMISSENVYMKQLLNKIIQNYTQTFMNMIRYTKQKYNVVEEMYIK